MLTENISRIINLLKEKTDRGEVLWTQSDTSSDFRVNLKNAVITTGMWSNGPEDINRADIIIINAKGETIDRFSEEEGLDGYQQLSELYNSARRSYYKVDETLNSILSELDSDNTVGRSNEDYYI